MKNGSNGVYYTKQNNCLIKCGSQDPSSTMGSLALSILTNYQNISKAIKLFSRYLHVAESQDYEIRSKCHTDIHVLWGHSCTEKASTKIEKNNTGHIFS